MNRRRIIEKHYPIIQEIEPLSPLSIGNGEFGFSIDVTGLQSFPEAYEVPLSTQSNWGWHYTGGKNRFNELDIEYQYFSHNNREIPYPFKPGERETAYHWLRQNPHRLQLGQLGFFFVDDNNQPLDKNSISHIDQVHNLLEGIVYSRYKIMDTEVVVETCCDPVSDSIFVRVYSELIQRGNISVVLSFPAPDVTNNAWSKTVDLNWSNEHRHQTKLIENKERTACIERNMDDDSYYVFWSFNDGDIHQENTHQLILMPNTADYLEFSVTFSKDMEMEHYQEHDIQMKSKKYWNDFWQNGAFISFEGSKDTRALELERRIILSQYLTAIHSGGSLPPQETGYMGNSWFGKIHLEMHWWHSAHFALWGREEIVDKSLRWYEKVLTYAEKLATNQGFIGARWPKMVGIDGQQSPSPVGPGLIWQQPHPIMLAELIYRANQNMELLRKYQEIIFQTADFMVDFVHWEPEEEAYVLGPSMIPAQECHRMEETRNPPFELEYWKFGLETAITWARRLGKKPNQKWLDVASKIKKPDSLDGTYPAHENCYTTFTEKNHDHPSMVAAYGILPGKLINREVMRKTLKRVKEEWRWETAWGWDFPMCAMSAARLGERELAIEFLLMDTEKNTYLPNGHNYQRPGLHAYLPGNGGLLTAVAMMVEGWEGNDKGRFPGFPEDEGWSIQAEGFQSYI